METATLQKTQVDVIAAGENKTAVLTTPEDRTFRVEEGGTLQIVFVFSAWDADVHTLVIQLVGESASASVIGFFVGRDKVAFKYTIVMEHLAAKTTGDTFVRGILFDQSRVDFRGTIKIEKAGIQSNAYLRHNTLLLSPRAHSNSTPALEILADDVKAGHAATTGTLDADAEFYLMSRGLSREEARDILVHAFVQEGLAKITNPQAREVAEVLVKRSLNPAEKGACCGGGCCQ